MAKMACYCGASMSDVNCPSENKIYVFKKEHVDAAIAYNPIVTLIDFITNWDEVTEAKKVFAPEEYEFWYCIECKRVYQVEAMIGGNKLASYVYDPALVPADTSSLFSMKQLIVFTDVEEDSCTEKNPQLLLSEFISSLSGIRYYITNDSSTVYAYDEEKDQVLFGYKVEIASNNNLINS